MDVEEEYWDVLQNIEKAIISVYKVRQDLLDMEVEEALDGLIRTYSWEGEQRGTAPLQLTGRTREVFDTVRKVCEFQLGRRLLELSEQKELMLERKSLNAGELLLCLRQVRRSIHVWTSVGGRQGYLEYVRKFLEEAETSEPDVDLFGERPGEKTHKRKDPKSERSEDGKVLKKTPPGNNPAVEAVRPDLIKSRELCEAAAAYHDLACWRWMTDEMIWGIQDPEGGEIGWCCVLGNLGELLGFLVYRGARGLASYMRVQTARSKAEKEEAGIGQDCLSLTYGERGNLQAEDLRVIKSLALKFRGKDQWPLFRDYLPGYVPWSMEVSGVRFLARALSVAVDVGRQVRESPSWLIPADHNRLLVFVSEAREGENLRKWRAESRPFPLEEISRLGAEEDARLELPAGVEDLEVYGNIWEVDVSYMFIPLQGKKGERPFIPRRFLAVDQASAAIVGVEILDPTRPGSDVRQVLCETFLKHKGMPGIIQVRSKPMEALLAPMADRLGIRLARVRTLKQLHRAERELNKFRGLL